MNPIMKYLNDKVKILKAAGIENARGEVYELLECVTGITKIEALTDEDLFLTELDEEQIDELVAKRASHIPLQHLTGVAYFYGHEFLVNENVLIPRFDTEILVEQVVNRIHDGAEVLDLCTGSGCIILSIAAEKKLTTAVGIDISEKALEVAAKNREKLGLEVTFLRSNIFEQVTGKFDCIVSNPPYIRTDVIPTLTEEVKNHDPMLALDGFEDGLYFYRKITETAPAFLKKGGLLALEIGFDQGQDVTALFKSHGFLDVEVIKDYGQNDRVVLGHL